MQGFTLPGNIIASVAEMVQLGTPGLEMLAQQRVDWEINPQHMTDLEILIKMAEEVNRFREYLGEVACVMIVSKMCMANIQAGKGQPSTDEVLARFKEAGLSVDKFVALSPEVSKAMLDKALHGRKPS